MDFSAQFLLERRNNNSFIHSTSGSSRSTGRGGGGWSGWPMSDTTGNLFQQSFIHFHDEARLALFVLHLNLHFNSSVGGAFSSSRRRRRRRRLTELRVVCLLFVDIVRNVVVGASFWINIFQKRQQQQARAEHLKGLGGEEENAKQWIRMIIENDDDNKI